MEKLKVGIIGCGGIANGKHMPALKKFYYASCRCSYSGRQKLPDSVWSTIS